MTEPTTAPHRDSPLSLREVTRESLRDVLRLKVAPEQERFVASNAVSIAQASFYPESAWFRAIYAGETPIGFVMLEDRPTEAKYHLWRYMIDQRFQGHGYGARALELVMAHVRTRPGATEFSLSCVPGDGGPGPFYEKLGFLYTGEVDDGELVMRRPL
jgi:diamine N-acetyltransferase